MIALNLAEAFDSVSPDALVQALRRFGRSDHSLLVFQGVCKHWRFKLRDANTESSSRVQHSGISQGCPLSPFLFTMVMSAMFVFMHDA